MAMNVKPEGSGSDPSPVAEINVTPLVDVMLVLLIIFMVTMPLMMSQLTITIPKPSATPPPLTKQPDPIYVYVVRDGTGMMLSTKKGERCSVDPSTVDAKIMELRPEISKSNELITVSGQQLVDYGRVVSAVEHLGLQGFEKVTLKEELDPYDPDPEVRRQIAENPPPPTSSTCTPGSSSET